MTDLPHSDAKCGDYRGHRLSVVLLVVGRIVGGFDNRRFGCEAGSPEPAVHRYEIQVCVHVFCRPCEEGPERALGRFLQRPSRSLSLRAKRSGNFQAVSFSGDRVGRRQDTALARTDHVDHSDRNRCNCITGRAVVDLEMSNNVPPRRTADAWCCCSPLYLVARIILVNIMVMEGRMQHDQTCVTSWKMMMILCCSSNIPVSAEDEFHLLQNLEQETRTRVS